MYKKIGGLVVSLTTVFSYSALAEVPQGYPADYQKVVDAGVKRAKSWFIPQRTPKRQGR